MEDVLVVVDRNDAAGRSVLLAANEVGQTASTLHCEVDEFLEAMKQDHERRSYERLPGHGAQASLSIDGGAAKQATINDISRGGISLICSLTVPAGTLVTIGLPAGGSVSGRVVRSHGELLMIAFRQDTASLSTLDRTLAMIAPTSGASAAAA